MKLSDVEFLEGKLKVLTDYDTFARKFANHDFNFTIKNTEQFFLDLDTSVLIKDYKKAWELVPKEPSNETKLPKDANALEGMDLPK